MPDSTLGNRLRERREAAGLSLFELCRRAHVSPVVLRDVESDMVGAKQRLSGRNVFDLAAELGCSVVELLEDAEPQR